MTKTLGEIRVRVEFNPSNDSVVHMVKEKFAEIIDILKNASDAKRQLDSSELLNDQKVFNSGELARVTAIAMTETENAAMWAVKALTAEI